MKKIFIIIGICIVVIIGFIAASLSSNSQIPFVTHLVTLRVEQPNLTVDVFQQSQIASDRSTKVTSLTSTQTLNLANGSYYYIATGKNIAPEVITFSITNNVVIEINPNFTSDYLASQVASQIDQINNAIKQTYPLAATPQYVINKGQLFLQGQWYATTLSDKRNSYKNPFDVYRVVMLNENNSWRAMTKPEISLSSVAYPGIPKIILSTINKVDPLSPPQIIGNGDFN